MVSADVHRRQDEPELPCAIVRQRVRSANLFHRNNSQQMVQRSPVKIVKIWPEHENNCCSTPCSHQRREESFSSRRHIDPSSMAMVRLDYCPKTRKNVNQTQGPSRNCTSERNLALCPRQRGSHSDSVNPQTRKYDQDPEYSLRVRTEVHVTGP